MKRVGRWLDRGKMHVSSSTQSLNSLAASQNLEHALQAVDLMMNDDIKGAEEGLAQGNSPFHQLSKSMILFMKATLGFEQDIMKEAAEQLAAAENSAYTEQYRVQKDSRAFQSTIYDKGTEYALCQAQAQIMSAVIAVLNESLTESLRGFYKVRKAYMTLNSIMQMEANYLKSRGSSFADSSTERMGSTTTTTPTAPPISSFAENDPNHVTQSSALRQTEMVNGNHDEDDDDDEFYDVSEDVADYKSNKDDEEHRRFSSETVRIDDKLGELGIADHERLGTPLNNSQSHATHNGITHDADSEIFANPLDVFIHSGTNLWFGLLSLMISVIPPSFSKILYIIGFRGEKLRGLRMLWQATKFANINGGMASLMVMGWYNALRGFCDIRPDADPQKPGDLEAYPADRLQLLLKRMRQRYPQSQLWVVEEARMEASHRQLDKSLALLAQPPKSQMKQLAALHMYEKSMCAMAAKQYQLAADSFMICIDINSWSQALYFYLAAAAHLEAYRSMQARGGDAREMEKHRKLAEEYFKTAPTKAGKKKMMGRQLPIEVYVNRKIAKWEERAAAWNCPFIEAVGVSPVEEMCFFWNLYQRMNHEQLEASLQNLAWSETNPHWEKEEHDEKGILALLRAIVLRNLRRHDEAMEILQTEILCHDPQLFRGGHKDDWTAPIAHFEMAVNLWMTRKQFLKQYGSGLTAEDNRGVLVTEEDVSHDGPLVAECQQWIAKAKAWDRFVMQERQGMKVTVGLDAVRKWEQKHATRVGK